MDDPKKTCLRNFYVNNLEAEAVAIRKYINGIDPIFMENDAVRMASIREKIADEISHLLGNLQDMLTLDGMFISQDGDGSLKVIQKYVATTM